MCLLICSGCSSNPKSKINYNHELGPYEAIELQTDAEREPLVFGVDEYNDPMEPVNRVFFYFNDKLYRFVVSPISSGYLKLVPKPLNNCISNAISNVKEPLYTANFLLQGKAKKAGKSLLRLCLNSTIGLFGLFDPADAWFGLDRETTTFGKTLANYGVSPGPYVVIPFLGPSTIRDAATLTFEYHFHPVKQVLDKPESTNVLIFSAFHQLAPTASNYDEVIEDAEDPYEFIRNLYLQSKIRDDKYEVRDEDSSK